MYKAKPEIKEIVSKFQKNLKKYGINAEKIILFGSHAKGTANENSDIDLIIVSRDFEKISFMKRCEILGKAIAEIMEPIEPLAYTPEEFANISPQSFIANILTQNEYVPISS